MYDPPGLPPAGWYPDPERPGTSRWWDGSAWAPPTWSAAARGDQLGDIGAMLSDAFRRALRRWRALAALGLIAGAVPGVLGSLAIARLLDGLAVVDEELVGWSSDRLPAVIALLVASAVAGFLGWIAMALLMQQEVDDDLAAEGGERRPLTTGGELGAAGSALLRSVALAPRAIGWGLVVVAAVLVAMASFVLLIVVAWPLAILLGLAFVPLGIWLMVKLAFVLQAIVDRPGNPLRRSWDVSRDRFWPVLGRLLVAGLVTGAINYGANTIVSFAMVPNAGFGGPAVTFEVEESGEVEDFVLDDVVDIGPLFIVATALGAMVSAVFATSTMNAVLSDLYRTRNRRST